MENNRGWELWGDLIYIDGQNKIISLLIDKDKIYQTFPYESITPERPYPPPYSALFELKDSPVKELKEKELERQRELRIQRMNRIQPQK